MPICSPSIPIYWKLALLDPAGCPKRDLANGRIVSDDKATLACPTVRTLSPDEAEGLGFARWLTHGKDRINFGLPRRLAISRGDRIGSFGSSYAGREIGFDETHLHFEIREFTGATKPMGKLPIWYEEPARGCSLKFAGRIVHGTVARGHCHWTPAAVRSLPTILDVERHLPPLPASTVPRDHGGWWESVPTTIRTANANRRVFEIPKATIDGTTLTAKVSAAFWRPVAYSRYFRISGRTNVAGIASTGPGVTGYGTDITAAPTKSDEACGGGAFQPAPVGSGATDEGELPRQTRDVSPSLTNGPCVIYILTTNALYPAPEASVVPRADDLYRRNVAIPDPKATLDYLGSLTANGAEGTLEGIAFHFYRIGALKGTRYEICAAPFGAAGCGEEPAARDTRLELFGPDGTRLQVSEDSSLTWVASSDATYVVMVRGGFSEHTLSVAKRESGEDNPPYAGPYALYYRATWLGPVPPSGFARGAITHNSVTVSWTPSDGVHQYVAKSTTGANCNAAGKEERITLSASDAAEGVSGAAGATVTRRFSGLEPSTDYHLCVRAVRTIEGLVLESGWASTEATTLPLPKLTVRVTPASTSCQTGSTVSISWRISGGTAPYAVNVGGVASSGTSKTVACQRTITVSATDSSTPQLSGSATVTLTVTNPPPPQPPPPTFTLSAEVGSNSCFITETVRIDWSTRNGSGDVTVTVNGFSVTTSPISVRCQSTAGSQKIIVRAQDGAGSSASRTFHVTVKEAATLVECLGHTGYGGNALRYRGSVCLGATASALWSGLASANIAVGCITKWDTQRREWLAYQSGRTDFNVVVSELLILSRSGCSSADEASGAAGAADSPCVDAVKPTEGTTAVSVGSATCLIVRGGGAAQITDGTHTLNLTLPTGRDWALFASSKFNDSSAGAFWFLDLTTGGWLALNPATAAELARHTPADADGLPAHLNAIAASASVPAVKQ